jgi:hypothetical protein
VITHLVLLEPRAALSDAQRQSALEAVHAAVTACPSVRACRVGRRVRHGLPGYEQGMRQDYQYALILDFDDLDGLRDYLTHPAHARLGTFFTEGASAALAYDYEIVDVEEAERLL